MATRLQDLRRQLGYSAAEVIDMLIRRAQSLNVPMMTRTSLKTKLSRWENGHEQVSAPYRRLFREIYGRTNEELGFPPEPEDHEAEELRSRLAIARTVDTEMVAVFRRRSTTPGAWTGSSAGSPCSTNSAARSTRFTDYWPTAPPAETGEPWRAC